MVGILLCSLMLRSDTRRKISLKVLFNHFPPSNTQHKDGNDKGDSSHVLEEIGGQNKPSFSFTNSGVFIFPSKVVLKVAEGGGAISLSKRLPTPVGSFHKDGVGNAVCGHLK